MRKFSRHTAARNFEHFIDVRISFKDCCANAMSEHGCMSVWSEPLHCP
jgi:hypothetical protein